MPKERDFAVDVLKMLAVFTIVWSHLDPVFPPPFDKLATGGSFGDGFFFFCSGFTILLGGVNALTTITSDEYTEYSLP